jgi:hypothetical protein
VTGIFDTRTYEAMDEPYINWDKLAWDLIGQHELLVIQKTSHGNKTRMAGTLDWKSSKSKGTLSYRNNMPKILRLQSNKCSQRKSESTKTLSKDRLPERL